MSEKDLEVGIVISVLDKATAPLDRVSQKVTGLGKAYRKAMDPRVSRGMDIMGASMIAAGGAAVWATARFEKQTSALRAFSGAATNELTAMKSAAMDAALGQRALGYTAGEAVQAQTELAKAGVKTTSIIGGGLNGTLALAATEGMNVAEAATYMSDTLNTFQLSGGQATRVADTLAAGSAASSTSVAGLAQSLAQAGLVANQTGLDLQDTVGVLSAFAQAGLKGSDAGTSLRTMLLRLNPVSNEAAAAIEKYGLSAYDAKGEFIGLDAFAGKLRAGLKDLSTEQRNQVLQTVYGQDAIRAATVVFEEGAGGIDMWTNSVSKSGEAQRMASEQTDNLYGDLNKLKASIDATLIKSGQGGNDALRSLTQTADHFVKSASSLPPVLLEGGAALSVLTGAAVLGVPRLAALRDATEQLGGVRRTLKGFGAGLAATVTVGLLAGATADAFAFNAQLEADQKKLDELRRALGQPGSDVLFSSIYADLQDVYDRTKAIGDSLDRGSISDYWDTAAVTIGGILDHEWGWGDVTESLKGGPLGFFTVLGDAAGEAATKLGDASGKSGAELTRLDGVLRLTARSFSTDTMAAQDMLDKFKLAGGSLNGTADQVVGRLVTWTRENQVGAAAADEAASAIDRQTLAYQRQAAAFALVDKNRSHRQDVIAYQSARDSAAAAAKKYGTKASTDGRFRAGTAAGRASELALIGMVNQAQAGWTKVDEDGNRKVEGRKGWETARQQVIDQATAFLGSEKAARSWVKANMDATVQVDKLGKSQQKTNDAIDKTARKKTPKREVGYAEKDARTGASIDITNKLTILEQHLSAIDGTTATIGVRLVTTTTAGAGVPASLRPPGRDATDPLGLWKPKDAIGDTTYSKAHGSPGLLARTLGGHAQAAAGLSGLRISNALVGGGGLGFGSGDHQAGRALDVVGPNLGEYIRRVRADGGFAEIHGSGPGRHAHSVPAGDTTTSRRRGAAAGSGTTTINVPVVVVGTVSADQVTGLTSAIRRSVEDWQRQLIERGTG
jgi:TP901 family phage tail tape measure protein